ncbi:MAG: glycosyltransferase family 2 protein [Vicinamibacterales bacterium]|nr:glycosyltransferase family 2 protein [Vicinamibacterales bacterium]
MGDRPQGGVVADVVIPVYNEGANIRRVLDSLKQVPYRLRVLVCYDFDEDDTLAALAGFDARPLEVVPVRNRTRGALEAVCTGLAASSAPLVITYPADDDYNGDRVGRLIDLGRAGHDVVVASRFMPGGTMEGCPPLKAFLVRGASLFLYYVARVPVRDATNGLRLFSRRLLSATPIEASTGFAYSIELLVKAHRMGLPIAETPFLWRERREGRSRFQVVGWLPEYLRWVRYALATTYLGRRAGGSA